MATEGLEARFARHRNMAERCWSWVDEVRDRHGLQLSVLAPPGYRSPTVTCIGLPEPLTGPPLVAGMAERGIVIGGGYGKLKATTIRIGHMGDHTLAELEVVLGELEEVLLAQ
jgi:aspartate aminotransferase-like enzyme